MADSMVMSEQIYLGLQHLNYSINGEWYVQFDQNRLYLHFMIFWVIVFYYKGVKMSNFDDSVKSATVNPSYL
jgi:hypothetical protein